MKSKTTVKAYRSAPRKNIDPIEVSSVSSLENLSKLARKAKVVEASITGFKLLIRREDLVPRELRTNLNLDTLNGTKVLIYLDLMNLEIAGTVKRTRLLGKDGYELGVDYSEDAPEYWRECLIELLPSPGELSE
jgi:hypothetical protein